MPVFNISLPEDKLIVYCARTFLTLGDKEQARVLLESDLNWSYLVKMAQLNGVTPLLYKNLHSLFRESVPQAVLEHLWTQFQKNRLNNLLLGTELTRLVKIFSDNGIRAIPFKGPSLAISGYRDLSLRTFFDLDILVRRADLSRAITLLIARGYKAKGKQEPDEHHDHNDERYHIFTRENGILKVDLQESIAGSHFYFRIDDKKLGNRLESLPLLGSSVPKLPVEEELFILCIHGAKHLFECLKWICDVAEMIRAHPEIDWDRVVKLAKTFRSERILHLGLFLAHTILDIGLPAALSRKIVNDTEVRFLAEYVQAKLLSGLNGAIVNVDRKIVFLRMRDRWWEKVRYWVFLCTTQNPSEKLPSGLPLPWLFFLFYQPILMTGKFLVRSKKTKRVIINWFEKIT